MRCGFVSKFRDPFHLRGVKLASRRQIVPKIASYALQWSGVCSPALQGSNRDHGPLLLFNSEGDCLRFRAATRWLADHRPPGGANAAIFHLFDGVHALLESSEKARVVFVLDGLAKQFGAECWSSCDELRGGMDASQYKDYVLILLFIRYVSDKYAGVPYAPITIPPGSSLKDISRSRASPT